jgi:hypothetical protein
MQLPINHPTVPTRRGWPSREFQRKTDPWASCRSGFDIAALNVTHLLQGTYVLFHRHWGRNAIYCLPLPCGGGRVRPWPASHGWQSSPFVPEYLSPCVPPSLVPGLSGGPVVLVVNQDLSACSAVSAVKAVRCCRCPSALSPCRSYSSEFCTLHSAFCTLPSPPSQLLCPPWLTKTAHTGRL